MYSFGKGVAGRNLHFVNPWGLYVSTQDYLLPLSRDVETSEAYAKTWGWVPDLLPCVLTRAAAGDILTAAVFHTSVTEQTHTETFIEPDYFIVVFTGDPHYSRPPSQLSHIFLLSSKWSLVFGFSYQILCAFCISPVRVAATMFGAER